MESKQKSIAVVSGGLDSTTLLYYLVDKGEDVTAVSFNYGQTHVVELEFASYHTKKLGVKHTVINLKDVFKDISSSSALLGGIEMPTIQDVVGDPQPVTYVPFRNAILLTVAASVAEGIGASKLYYGAQKHDEYSGYWDTTQVFTDSLQAMFNLNRKNKITIEAPFVEKSKSDLVKIGTELGLNYAKTMTCYSGTDCGICPTCADRIQAFKRAGLEDPKTYGR